ncbi:MAG: hypothetical protein GDA67_13570 [Nitrospira sp. CR1.3]|nr:hypothetical protein [Nitrospira sp. CR1.3]
MMEHRDDKVHKLERALTEVYRSRPDFPAGTIDVTHNVMRAIRQSAGEGSRLMPSIVLDQLVWRTATIAAAIVLCVTVFTVSVMRTTPGESAGVLAEELESAPLYGDF